MDKRKERTLDCIHTSFARLLSQKDYDEITIQDILDDAGISRSTFYAHFKTKDELLLNVSKHIFDHVFSKSLQEEKTHDFSNDVFYDYRHLAVHIFYHVRDEREIFTGIFKSRGIEMFLSEFRKYLYTFVSSYYNNYPVKSDFPLELRKELAVEDFVVILKHWIKDGFAETPEEMGEIFFKVLV